MPRETLRESDIADVPSRVSRPGVAIVYCADQPTLDCRGVAGGLVLGRDALEADGHLSREHLRIERDGDAFVVTDLGSRNGTRVGGERIAEPRRCAAPAVVRAGRTVMLLLDDIAPIAAGAVAVRDAVVVGPRLRSAWDAVEAAARAGGPVMLTGESGAGKELAAELFHRTATPDGPLVSVNCATIPAGLAEGLLFGAKRGAYSGAVADSDGYLVAADGGTLFLDEVADLDLDVQAKLLRVLETGEVLPLGSARSRQVSIRIVAATLKDVRAAVADQRFRADLYYRIGQPLVCIPALRERPEEIPWLISVSLANRDVALHPSFVEACLLRPWPGNTRELVREVVRAAAAVTSAGRDRIRDTDLDELAGLPIGAGPAGGSPADGPAQLPSDDVIEQALRAEHGNISRTAQRLGLHRNQVRRWLTRHPDLEAWARTERQR